MRVRLHLALPAALALLAATFMLWVGTASAQEFNVRITTGELQVRAAPNTSSAIVGSVFSGDVVQVTGEVGGEEVVPGNATWFRTANGNFIYSAYARPSGGTAVSDATTGRRIEVDRSEQIARAIENGQVVYTAPVTVGVPAFATPVGNYQVIRRVANETMDSSTVGIPINSPNGYFLTDVLYTQYFNNGYAIHYNYWSPPSVFGNVPASHGCIGMQLADAEFFWNFASLGTPVTITN